MKIAAIIAEYNPFHNGHEYQIRKAKEITGADFVIVIMSGNFTQQGNISIVNKFSRADMAISCGADLVLELPTIFATSNAETFAYGAVNILDKLNCIDYLVFGIECSNISILENIVDKTLKNTHYIDNTISEYIKSGVSYISAKDKALKTLLSNDEYVQFSKPNNILGIEYLKSLRSINSSIKPITIPRVSSEHNDISLNNEKNFSSGTSIRNSIANVGLDSVNNHVPSRTFDILSTSNLLSNDSFFKLLRYKILKLKQVGIKNIYEVSEGLENKIYEGIILSTSYQDLLIHIKSKRYTMSRLKRILVHILLDITTKKKDDLLSCFYARVLKVSKKNKNILLGIISNSCSIPLITNVNKPNDVPNNILESITLDFDSNNIYNILSNSNLNTDRTNML